MTALTPQDIAREAVKRMSARKLPPTPEHFQALYHEVAGTRPLRPFPLDNLRQIGHALPENTPAQQRFKSQFAQAVASLSWSDLEKTIVQYVKGHAPSEMAAPTVRVEVQVQQQFPPELLEQLARIVANALPASGSDDPKLAQLADELLAHLRQPSQHTPTLRRQMADFAFHLAFVAAEQSAVRAAMLKLLHAVLEHVSGVHKESPRLQQQLQAVLGQVQPPLSLRQLDEAQSQLRDLTRLQLEAEEQAAAVWQSMKDALALFLQRLSRNASGSQQQGFARLAQQLGQASSLADITPLLLQAIQAARQPAGDGAATGPELQASPPTLPQVPDRAATAAALVARIGLNQRSNSHLCLALLDLEEFRRSHARSDPGSDEAFAHLATVARAALRAQDTLARCGDEEIIILLPDTDTDTALGLVQQLQRELSTALFMGGSGRGLITFSAGLTRMQPGEPVEQALERADQALQAAKQAGKNRVLSA